MPRQGSSGSSRRRWLGGVLLVVAVFAALAILILLRGSQRRVVRLADGSSLEWLGLTVGTNALLDGSPIEKLLGERIPDAGWTLGPITLKRPTRTQIQHRTLENDCAAVDLELACPRTIFAKFYADPTAVRARP